MTWSKQCNTTALTSCRQPSMWTIYSTVWTVYSTMWTIYSTMWTIYSIMGTIYSTMRAIYNTMWIIYSTMWIIYRALWIIYRRVRNKNWQMYQGCWRKFNELCHTLCILGHLSSWQHVCPVSNGCAAYRTKRYIFSGSNYYLFF